MQSFALHLWRHQLTPLIALVSFGLLLVSSLTHQLVGWNAFMMEEPKASPAEPTPDRAVIDLNQVAELFKPKAPETKATARSTDLPLTLLGSFVHTRPEQSVAVIQVMGHAPTRVVPGKELVEGVRLEAVHSDYVVLVRGSVSENLFFPRVMAMHSTSTSVGRSAAYPAFQATQLKKLPRPATKESQQKVQALLLDLKR